MAGNRILHERTNLALCRFAFVAMCLIPSLVIAGWSWRQRSLAAAKARAGEWSDYISTAFGARTSLHSVTNSHPHKFVFHNGLLQDNEASQTLLAFDEAEWDQEARQLKVPALKLHLGGLTRLVDWLDQRMLRNTKARAVSLEVAQLYLIWAAERGVALQDARLEFSGDEKAASFKLSAAMEGYAQKLVVEVRRDREVGQTQWLIGLSKAEPFDKGQLPPPVPYVILQRLCPALPDLGKQAWFHGRVEGTSWDKSSELPRMSLVGVLARSELEAIAGKDFLGTTTLWVDRFELTGNRLTALQLLVKSSAGDLRILAEWLRRPYRDLGNALTILESAAPTSTTLLDVEALLLRVDLFGEALQLSSANGAVLRTTAGHRVLLERPIQLPRTFLPSPLR